MYTDMVGYTALGQRNESLSLALVDEQRKLLRPIIERHRGREVKTMGDGFLVEFPSALDAVRSAYDIQRVVREFNFSQPAEQRIHLRVGLHLGDVVEADGDISGDAVNVASRIEPLAEDGGVCLTRQVYDHVQNKFELPIRSLGVRTLKNVNAQIEVYKIIMPWETSAPVNQGESTARRIAVMPLVNMSPDPNDAYFADGMTEELITTISTIGGLRVISRTSVMNYRNSPKKLVDIAGELGVGVVMEGSVRKVGKRVRITVQLIDARTDEHLWANSYDRELEDIFAIQNDVAKKVADALMVQMALDEKNRLSRPRVVDPVAYQDYIVGRYFRSQTGEETERKALEYFREATKKDPSFAEAYAGLAKSYESLGHGSYMSFDEAMTMSRSMAEKALSIDRDVGEGHAALGLFYLGKEWNLTKAEEEFKKALSLNPSDSSAHRSYARCLSGLGRTEEAIAHAEMAVECDPLSPGGLSNLGLMYMLAGREEEAWRFWQRANELFPTHSSSRFWMTLFQLSKGLYNDAERTLGEVGPSELNEPYFMQFRGYLYARTGRVDDAKKLLDAELALCRRGYASEDHVSFIYLGLRDTSEFFGWLEKAVEIRHTESFVLKYYRRLFPEVADDPRWKGVLQKARIL